jgi:hypothetical protein
MRPNLALYRKPVKLILQEPFAPTIEDPSAQMPINGKTKREATLASLFVSYLSIA